MGTQPIKTHSTQEYITCPFCERASLHHIEVKVEQKPGDWWTTLERKIMNDKLWKQELAKLNESEEEKEHREVREHNEKELARHKEQILEACSSYFEKNGI